MLKCFGRNQRIIHWWLGTDSLKLVLYPPGKSLWYIRIFLERLFWKMTESLYYEHWAVNQRVSDNLIRFGINPKKIKIVPDKPAYVNVYKKSEHGGINILYYIENDRTNQKYKDWVYGKDIIDRLINRFPDYNFIKVDGSADMEKIYPIIDAYIRPNRHDGSSRMIAECKANDIPCLWTVVNPDYKIFESWLECLKK
jgi:hypothetical protein